MAFGIKRDELYRWKDAVSRGEIAFLTHYWLDDRFAGISTVTKVGCSDLERLTNWCLSHGLNPQYIHHSPSYPHYDLFGPIQKKILELEHQWEQIERFHL
ncbi:hypothetical protein HZF08_24815 [Paenibacillus sp. CGMCC 1.16610]|uniref:DUF4031 domain-containing protein n=2 Tax=Paenibacillus TaxID=44249 RepID=A0ABU6DFJ9_9BACL|nr:MULTISPECIES: hypothetical protein [Paenibacillus]MBA2941511.1 hypothetical protein [Paenibacillus sp. CGMCC 1.16610]MCY9662135.1 hypothetical protein [Paenibacillus anseongense]MEB4795647.1 hypothetical protein [Paenibacillus chondroitinus]MVQ40326.1 hypothetical protein [Paenibacillus anseongense]